MAATFNPQAAADQARNAFTVIVLGAIFVLATAHVAASDPAPAYNCGDRGVSYCIVRYSYPCATNPGRSASPPTLSSRPTARSIGVTRTAG